MFRIGPTRSAKKGATSSGVAAPFTISYSKGLKTNLSFLSMRVICGQCNTFSSGELSSHYISAAVRTYLRLPRLRPHQIFQSDSCVQAPKSTAKYAYPGSTAVCHACSKLFCCIQAVAAEKQQVLTCSTVGSCIACVAGERSAASSSYTAKPAPLACKPV